MNPAEAVIAVGTLLSGVGALAAWRHSKAAGKELRPNGGSSFRDEVNGLRDDLRVHAQSDLAAQEQVTARLETLEQYNQDRWRDLDSKWDAIAGLSTLLRNRLEGSPDTDR